MNSWRGVLLVITLSLAAIAALFFAGLIPGTKSTDRAVSTTAPSAPASATGAEGINAPAGGGTATTTTEPLGVLGSTPVVTELSTAEVRRLASLGITPGDGPTVAIDEDPLSTSLPTARSLNLLAQMPADWAKSFLTAQTAINALGTPDAARGQQLQPTVSPALYTKWLNNLNSPTATRGTFTLQRLSLAGTEITSRDELPVAGNGTFRSADGTSTYLVAGTMTRGRNGWALTRADFILIGEGN